MVPQNFTLRNGSTLIRVFARADAARCCEIIKACISTMEGLNDPARTYIYSQNSPNALHEALEQFYTLVCEGDGVVLGLASLAGNEVKRLYVHPTAQAKGVGSTLLLAIEDEAKRRGLLKLVTQSSPDAASFYSSFGFKVMGTETLRQGDAEFWVVNMEKDL